MRSWVEAAALSLAASACAAPVPARTVRPLPPAIRVSSVDCGALRAQLERELAARHGGALDLDDLDAAERVCPRLDLSEMRGLVRAEREAKRDEERRVEGTIGVVESEDGRYVAERTAHGVRVFRHSKGAAPEPIVRVSVDEGQIRFLPRDRLLIEDAPKVDVIDLTSLHVDRMEASAFVEAHEDFIVTGSGRARLLRGFDFQEISSVELRSSAGGAIFPLVDRAGRVFGAIVGAELVSFDKKQSLGVHVDIGVPTSDHERVLACRQTADTDAPRYAVISTRTGDLLFQLPQRCEDEPNLVLDPSGRYAAWLGRTGDGKRIVVESLDVAKGTRRSLPTPLPYVPETNVHLGGTGERLCVWAQTLSSMESRCGFGVGASGAIEYTPAKGTFRSDWGNTDTAFGGTYELIDEHLVSRASHERLVISPERWARTPRVDLTADE